MLAAGGGAAVVGALALTIRRTWLAARERDVAPKAALARITSPLEPQAAIAATSTDSPTNVPTAPAQVDASDALVETALTELAGLLRRGDVAASALVDAAERRVRLYDARYGAMIEMNPDALVIAQARDEELAQGQWRGPLHGVPVLLKDIFATGDRMRTTAGALALEQNDVAEDAAIVRRLREAGAVILGKTNMTEWSNVRSSGQTAGWSDRGGQTRNPYNPTMSPWGSSSGSAAAVALSYAPVALGVETNGSILCPAAACGVVGLKPTVGLVSRVGVMPVTRTLDSPGPIARSVADVAAALNVIAGYDQADPAFGIFRWSSPVPREDGTQLHDYDEIDYTAALDPHGLQGARLGICWQLWGMDPEADAVGMAVVDLLREAGADVIEGVWIPTLGELYSEPGIGELVNTEFAAGMAAFFERFMPNGPVHALQDVVDWNIAHADVALAISGQEWLIGALSAPPLDDPSYVEILAYMTTKARGEGLDWALDEFGLDAIIAPTAPIPTEITIGGGTDFAGSSTLASALAGYPSITVPMGDVNGLPVGLHLSGRAFSEATLIRLASGVEQLLQARVPPIPTVSDGP